MTYEELADLATVLVAASIATFVMAVVYAIAWFKSPPPAH